MNFMQNENTAIPRLAPHMDFPAYAFVPGMNPHPTHSPDGHSYNRMEEDIEAPDPKRWTINQHYLYGIDLFNHGYYWEAHEIWEDLWNADGRVGLPSDFFKGLIKLAAAGVKVREGVSRGIVAHARGAAELFSGILSRKDEPDVRYMGLSLRELIAFARSIETNLPRVANDGRAVFPVFDFVLIPT